jgi:hypothetical protein
MAFSGQSGTPLGGMPLPEPSACQEFGSCTSRRRSIIEPNGFCASAHIGTQCI